MSKEPDSSERSGSDHARSDRSSPRFAEASPAAPGFTLIELGLALAVVTILAAIAIPSYTRYVGRSDRIQAISDIQNLDLAIRFFKREFGGPPGNLAAIGENPVDPWGNPYQYLNLGTAPPGMARKDNFLVPINSDYDLYSMGPDGASQPPLTAEASRDDIVRANDGEFIGLALDY
jgi:general secretion pathway protein G